MRRCRQIVGALVFTALAAGASVLALGSSSVAGGAIGYVVTVEGTEQPTCRVEQLDLATGTLTPLGDGARSLARCVWDLAFTPDAGVLYGLRWDGGDPTTVSLVTFDITTGEVTDVGQVGTFAARLGNAQQLFNGGGLAVDNDGTVYVSLDPVAQECDGTFDTQFCTYTVNPADPSQVTFLGLTTGTTGAIETPIPNSFAVACDGGFTGGQQVDAVDGPQALTSIDRTSGLGTVIDGFNTEMAGMDYDFDGTLWGVANPDAGQLYTIDRATAVPTPVATIEAFVGALAIPHPCETPPPPPPEPIPAEVTFTG